MNEIHNYHDDPRTIIVLALLEAMEHNSPVATRLHAGMIVSQLDSYARAVELGIGDVYTDVRKELSEAHTATKGSDDEST